MNNVQWLMLLAEDLRQLKTSKNLLKILLLEKGELLPLCLVLLFLNTLPRKAFFVMQTADSKSDVLMAQWQTAEGCTGSGGGSGLWLESSSNSPSVSNVSFSHQQERWPRIAPIGWRAMEGKRWKSERTREKDEETLDQVNITSFCQTANILQIY